MIEQGAAPDLNDRRSGRMDRKLYVVYGNRAKRMTMDLMEAARISEEIPQGASVALKPNLVVAAEP